MAYEVIARKWRPQTFEDVVGQAHVTETLRNAIKMNRIAHAYLFVGPRGIGKTSVARIFAKALNCVNGPTMEPCGKCDSCKEIASGSSLDVMEIDGASNNGVEQVRELRETVKYMPTHGKYKIYIIDEVHMLSQAAFNALLKTLEEPPPHVKFFFATTEAEKILPTIISRCQRFDLRRIPVSQISERLKLIAKEEKVKIDDDAVLAIARGAEGGLRDAESALDQLISFKGKEIKEEDVLSVFGLVSRSILEQLADRILTGDVKGLIGTVGELDASGKDLQRLMLELIEHFRNLLVWFHAGEKGGIDLVEAQMETVKKQAGLGDSERFLRIIGIMAETEDRLRGALSKRTLLETALIRCARAATVVSLEDILAELNLLKGGGPRGGATTDETRKNAGYGFNASAGGQAAPRVADAPSHVQRAAAPAQSAPVAKQAGTPAQASHNFSEELENLNKNWRDFVDRVEKMAVGTRSALNDARAVKVEAEKVIIGLDSEFAAEKKTLEVQRSKIAVQHVLSAILKRKVGFEVAMVEGGAPADEEPVQEDEPRVEEKPEAPPPAAPAKKKGMSRSDLLKDPAVNKVLELFNGTVVDVRE